MPTWATMIQIKKKKNKASQNDPVPGKGLEIFFPDIIQKNFYHDPGYEKWSPETDRQSDKLMRGQA